MAFHAAMYDGKLGYQAQDDRQLVEASLAGVGALDLGDLVASAGTGMNSSIAVGRATVRNTFMTVQGGLYLVRNDAPVSQQHATVGTTGDGSARVDNIFLKVYDSESGGDSSDAVQLVIGQGSEFTTGSYASASAALDARPGASASPSNAILLSDVYIPDGAGGAAGFTYRDRRPLATNVAAPNVKNALSPVYLRPDPSLVLQATSSVGAGGALQGAYACFLPRKVPGATKIRWAYTQGGTAATGTYNIGIADASGRLIVSTGIVSFTGAALSLQQRAETIASTIFEAGVYYLVFGVNNATGSASFGNVVASNSTPIIPNLLLTLASGGTTLPVTLAGFTDLYASPGALQSAPQVALSTV